jgi:hypothetical protein
MAAQLAQLHRQVAHAWQVLGRNALQQRPNLLGVQRTVVPAQEATDDTSDQL